jgi:tRNA(fMet)-specific endonuclease VapC
MSIYLLDTNIISAILRRVPLVQNRLRDSVPAHDQIWLSAVVYYESKRGLLKRDAKNQMESLELLTTRFEWCDVIQDDWERAAHMWASRFKIGRPIEDADLLIAAQAKRLNAILVTDNAKDFDGLNVSIENWREG